MKKIVLLFLTALVLNVVTIVAQAPQGGRRMTVEERAQATTEWMTKELNLTAEQIAPVDSINLLFTKAQQILFQSAEGDRDKIRESMASLEKEKETALSKVLTADQLNTYKQKAQEMMEQRRRGRNR